MRIREFRIADGNSTALVYDCPPPERDQISRELLQEVEQVAFVITNTTIPALVMMGGELCINATLAFASTLESKGILKTSGLKDIINYSNENSLATIEIAPQFKREQNVILLEGIGYVLYNAEEKSDIKKLDLVRRCKKHGLPAFGGILYNQNKITPYVYVDQVGSFVRETACGSGSLAFHIFSGIEKVVQPTGRVISVTGCRKHSISAHVTACTYA